MKLSELHKRAIAVELEIGADCRIVRGIGNYECSSGTSPVLRIEVAEEAGNFELILNEQHWQGPILADREFGCEYRIRLRAQDLQVQR
jgi:hypothetical protein